VKEGTMRILPLSPGLVGISETGKLLHRRIDMINQNGTWKLRWKILALCAVLVLGAATLTHAQEGTRTVAEIQADINALQAELREATAATEEQIIKIYSLDGVPKTRALRYLSSLIGVRVVLDEESNSIVVAGSEVAHENVQELLTQSTREAVSAAEKMETEPLRPIPLTIHERLVDMRTPVLINRMALRSIPEKERNVQRPASFDKDIWANLGIKYEQTPTSGVRVMAVRKDSLAEQAGLVAGDIIVGFGQWKIASVNDMRWATLQEWEKLQSETGDVRVDVIRDNQHYSTEIPVPKHVIPAQAGIQTNNIAPVHLDPRLRGGDGNSRFATPVLQTVPALSPLMRPRAAAVPPVTPVPRGAFSQAFASVTVESAQDTALASVGGGTVARIETKFPKHGMEYKVIVVHGNYRYDVHVSALTGNVVSLKPHLITKVYYNAPGVIDVETAKSIAIQSAGGGVVTECKLEHKKREGMVYSIKVANGQFEHSVELLAATGTVYRAKNTFKH
jgi:uncharacterized membrane protein YkoI